MVIHPYLKSTNNKSSFGQVSLFNGFLNDLNTLNAFQQQSLAQAQQQQQIAVQQLAIMETAIKKEIFELLSATQSQQNLALLAQRSQLLTHLGNLQREQQQHQNNHYNIPQGTTNNLLQQTIPVNNNNNNIYCPPPPTPSVNSVKIEGEEEEGIDFVDFDFIEKQIAAQNNRLSAAEAEAVAVLAGLASFGNYQNK
uniref:Uncharacterized protein n=1 Tax=Meloidogyne javanica TaxID=6303 RepID=A0A915MUC1_MELJA